MRIAVFGASGGTGRHVVAQALDGGHEVSALVRSRRSADVLGTHERLQVVVGRLEEPADVDAAVTGADAVVSALGGAQRGPTWVCTDGIRAILAAMGRQGVRRLVVVSAHGAAESRDRSPYALAVWASQRHRMRDKERMEELIRAASRNGTVDATVVRPPGLGDGPRTGRYATGTDLRIGLGSRIPRADLADFLLHSAVTGSHVGQAPRIVAGRARRRPRRARDERGTGSAPTPAAGGSMSGRVAMVTGATGGMGAVIATDLARRGATVVLTARDERRGRELAETITADTGNPRVEVLAVDLADQASIRRAVATFRERHDALHVLVNNAGLHVPERRLTRDGVEVNLAVNHLGWFLLTNLLLDVLRAGAPARIVNVASQAMADARPITVVGRPRPAVLDLDDLQAEHDFRPMAAYGRAKLAMVMGTYTLARRLEGTGVTVNALHPGLVATGIVSGFGVPRVLLPVVVRLTRLFMAPPEVGARTAIHLATSPEVEGVTGRYLVDGEVARSPETSYDRGLQEALWEASEALTGLAPRERTAP